MSGWNFLTRTGVTMGTSYSKVCYQFLQEKLFRFRVESVDKMRKHLTQQYNLTNTSWNSRWELSVQGAHLRYLDSSLYTGHQLKQRLPFPTSASNTKSQNSSWLFACQGYSSWQTKSDKMWGWLNLCSQLGQTTGEVWKRFQSALQRVHLLIYTW